MKVLRVSVPLFGLGGASAGLLSGCGGSDEQAAPAKISPEMQKKQDEMLQNYGKQNADLGRSKRQGKK